MSRLVMFLGILLILVGGAGMVFGFVGVPAQLMSSISQAVQPKAEDLCKPGEELVKNEGPESYSPSMGYGRSVTYYCVNSDGVRREVTGDFVQGMFGQVLGSMGSLAIPIVASSLCAFGFVLALVGFVFSRRRRFQTVTSQYVFAGANPSSVYPVSTATSSNQPPPARPPVQGDLAAKLRQIEDAHTSGLITDEEYQRMRQEILGTM